MSPLFRLFSRPKLLPAVTFSASALWINIAAAQAPIELPTSGEVAASPTLTVVHLITNASFVVQCVIALLVFFSVVSWGIVFSKVAFFWRAKKQSQSFDNVFWSSKNLAQITEASKQLLWSPVASVYLAGHEELHRIVKANESRQDTSDFNDLENIDRALKKAKMKQVSVLEKGTTFLATTASAAPFIGLFGTVWGIMNAFLGLSHAKNTSIQAVAPGISEALIATAIGLAAAIPAAIAYNYFMQEVRVLARGMDTFSAEFLNIARRHFFN